MTLKEEHTKPRDERWVEIVTRALAEPLQSIHPHILNVLKTQDTGIERVFYCQECGHAFVSPLDNVIPDCPHCHAPIDVRNALSVFQNDLLAPASMAQEMDGQSESVSVLVVTDYNVRLERLRLTCFSCRIEARSKLNKDDLVRSLSSGDLPDLKYDKPKISLNAEYLFRFDHQGLVRLSGFPGDRQPLNTKNIQESCFSSSGSPVWPHLVGEPEVLDQLRRHHYPTDACPVEFLRWLAERTQEEILPSREFRRELGLLQRSSGAFEYGFSRQKVEEILREHYKKAKEESGHTWVTQVMADAAMPVLVIPSLTREGLLLIHAIRWRVAHGQTADPAEFRPELLAYSVLAMGEHTYWIRDMVASYQPGRRSKMSFEEFAKRFAEQPAEVSPDLPALMKRSLAARIGLHKLAGDDPDLLWKMLGGYQFSGLLPALYRSPALVELIERGWTNTLCRYCVFLCEQASPTSSVAELLGMSEELLEHLTAAEYDSDLLLLENTKVLFPLFGFVPAEQLRDLEKTGGRLLRFSSNDIESLALSGRSLQQILAYVRTVPAGCRTPVRQAASCVRNAIRLGLPLKMESYSEDLARLERLEGLLLHHEASFAMIPLRLNLAALHALETDGVEIVPVWDFHTVSQFLLDFCSATDQQEESLLYSGPLLLFHQNGTVVDIAYIDGWEGQYRVEFFKNPSVIHSPEILKAAKAYEQTFSQVFNPGQSDGV